MTNTPTPIVADTQTEWRTCGSCGNIYEGQFGDCQKCKKIKKTAFGGSTGRKIGRVTLDIMEGNHD
ncbi:MAG: hypothetical protein COA52_02435 [Hyphomicrobiales bacterium]|nr:MAG: hypothetical protein COA52_02435 [Hyphomicrobiales bacterium]